MAFSGQDPILAKRRFFHAPLSAAAYQLCMAFFSWLNQQGGKPDLQIVEFTNLTATETIFLAGTGTLRAVVLIKSTTTAAWAKFADHNTTYTDNDTEILKVKQSLATTDLMFYPKGKALATGLVGVSHTTGAGTTTSAGTDGATGVVLLSAA